MQVQAPETQGKLVYTSATSGWRPVTSAEAGADGDASGAPLCWSGSAVASYLQLQLRQGPRLLVSSWVGLVVEAVLYGKLKRSAIR